MFIRGIAIGGLCLAAAGLTTPAQAGIPGGCIEFFDEVSFVDYCAQHGKILKGIEDFEESNIVAGGKVPLPAPLQGNIPNVDPVNGQGFPNGLAEKNLIIQDNVFPGPNAPFPDPSGDPSALFVIGPGFGGANSVKVGEDLFILDPPVAGSLDLIFTDPVHTGVGFELSRFQDYPLAGWHISVFAMDGTEIGKFMVPEPPGPEPVKSFWGIWCFEPIGRINIWDEASPGPDGIDNIQMWMEQYPVCPWDCAVPANKVVDVVDFLALLAQWGQIGVPCDFDGNGVSVTDFLKLLAMWGPCPTPINDECLGAERIDKFDPNGTEEIHFDMYASTPSPDPYKCIDEPPVHKDTWYCLTNVTGQRIGVTITTTMPLLIEVNDGCVCPPGPLVACGYDGGTEQFPMDDGQQVLIRLVNWLDLPNEELKGSMFIANKPLDPGLVNFFLDRGLFDEELIAQGKFAKAIWAFKPDFVPIGTPPIIVNDILDINSHPLNAPGVWQNAAGDNMWPPEVDNVQFSSNLNPGGPLQPAPDGGMAYLKPQSVPEIDNNALTSFLFLGSFDIISGPPAGDNHTAIAFDLVSWDENGIDDPIKWNITAYDKADQAIGNFRFEMQQPMGKVFLGMVTKDPTITIGRVDIWDEMCSYEGISMIELYQPEPPVQVNFFEDLDLFFAAVGDAGKTEKFAWDFKPHNNPPFVPFLADFLDILTHGQNPDDPWTDPGGVDMWPPHVDNVQFVSNANPQGPLAPGGGLAFIWPGNFQEINNNAVVEANSEPSFDIISGLPLNDNHTAFWLEMVSVQGPLPTQLHVTVYDKADNEMGRYVMDYFGDKARLGILTKGPDLTIGRIDIWDPAFGNEGISFIAAFWQDQPASAPATGQQQTVPDPD